MSAMRPLRGSCQCGRNRYIIEAPQDASEAAQVLFHSDHTHQISVATPLPVFLRVPLAWYRSSTHPLFPDESNATIHRVYSHPAEPNTQRHFCGFCGTPLSFWTESPFSEADYIQLTLGSLDSDDLLDLENLGLIPDLDDLDSPASAASRRMSLSCRVRQHKGVPWLERLVEDTKIGHIRRQQGVEQTKTTRVEWEVVEWSEEESDACDDDNASHASKRKLVEVEEM